MYKNDNMKFKMLLIGLLLSTVSLGNGINVSGVSFNSTTNKLSFTLTWDNSFYQSSGINTVYDGAWVFIKYAPNGGDVWYHANILDSTAVSGINQFISYDDLGIMVFENSNFIGTFGPYEFTVELAPLVGIYQDFKVFATEMVYANQGDFNAGDGSSFGRFYADGDATVPWTITSEDLIIRGFSSEEFNQQGSSSTTDLYPNFPKGWDSFWAMKYKITAQQYADFLNCLTREQQNSRVQADLSGNTASNKYVMTDTPGVMDRNPIACDTNIGTGDIKFYLDLDDSNAPNSSNDGANIALNHLTPADIIAYFDWSGLRPMSELEYEKVCRGQGMPAVAGEHVWGTSAVNPAGSITNPGTQNEATTNVGGLNALFDLQPLRAGFAATSTSSRTEAGAAFTGMMDGHNLGEFMYGVESVNFSRYAYGDGQLDNFGNAIVVAWTVSTQLLSTIDPNAPNIEPISKGKTEITPITRSAYMGGRGVRKLIQ